MLQIEPNPPLLGPRRPLRLAMLRGLRSLQRPLQRLRIAPERLHHLPGMRPLRRSGMLKKLNA